MIRRMKVAFVVQRYGLEVNGGAELHCRSIAEHMSKYWDVEVLTTCAVDYLTWKNEYKPGIDTINGIKVRRFEVSSPRNWFWFGALSKLLPQASGNRAIGLKWMKAQGPYSPALFDFIKKEQSDYDCFIFFTYLYCTTFFGLPLVKEKAVLVPTAEDSPQLKYGIFKELFKMPRAFIYNALEEKKLLDTLYENPGIPGDVVGVGVDFPAEMDGKRFRDKFNIKSDFILYVGRITVDKGCDEMFRFFKRYKKENPGDLKLVLMGKSFMAVPEHPDIVNLGFVTEQDKFDALNASRLLLMPSPYESLSIVLLEAWLAERPVLVNKKCDVMVGQCERSNGGLSYSNYEEFSKQLGRLLKDDVVRKRLGRSGKEFTEKNYGWDVIEKKYIKLLNGLAR